MYGKCESGQVYSEVFLEWTKTKFLHYYVQESPVLLIIQTRMTLDYIESARKHEASPLCILSHTTCALHNTILPITLSLLFKKTPQEYQRMISLCGKETILLMVFQKME